MELSFLTKLRIAAVVAVGVILIGILAWPLAQPSDPFGVVSLFAGGMSVSGAITLAGLAFLAGLLSCFLSWPYGREIGILAVPSGLALWALRSGSMADLIRLNPTITQRQQLYASLKWESFFWLAIVAVGFLGVLLAQKISRQKTEPQNIRQNAGTKLNTYLNKAIALVSSVLIAQFLIVIFAQDVRMFDKELGSVVAQPAVGQIVFAVLFAFGIVAFLVKKFFDISYIWPVIASALVPLFAGAVYLKQEVLQHLLEHWPAVFFSSAVASVLPVQLVSFGALGSIIGYWLAVRYIYWRKYESQ